MEQKWYREPPFELPILWKKVVSSMPKRWFERLTKDLFTYGQLLRDHRIEPKSCIYLGANAGQLLWLWSLLGFREIVMVEAQPEIFASLNRYAKACEKILNGRDRYIGDEPRTRLRACHCAVGDYDGETEFHVLKNSWLSSLKKPDEALANQREDEFYQIKEIATVPMKNWTPCLRALNPTGI